jgi:hypothetical protein
LIVAFVTGSQQAFATNNYSGPAQGECQYEPTPCRLPYFVIQGGDISVGSGFANTANDYYWASGCDQQTYVSFGAWNNNNTNGGWTNTNASLSSGAWGPGYYGGSDQGAVLTPDTSQEVVTDQNSDVSHITNPEAYTYNNGAELPSELGFANKEQNWDLYPNDTYGTDDNAENQYYGGDYGLLPCMPDPYTTGGQNLSNAATYTVNLSTLTPGTYNYTGELIVDDNNNGSPDECNGSPVTTSDNPIPAGNKINLNVDGIVYIESNITYCYSNTSNIPQLQINETGVPDPAAQSPDNGYLDDTPSNTQFISSGLFIQYDVTELHGFFTAEQHNAGSMINPERGTIFDCAYMQGGTIYTSANLDDAASGVAPDDCDHQLQIYGTMEANLIYLERSYGDLNPEDAGAMSAGPTNEDNAAEVFNYSPEVWIPDAATNCTVGSCVTSTYEAETSLPPVL